MGVFAVVMSVYAQESPAVIEPDVIEAPVSVGLPSLLQEEVSKITASTTLTGSDAILEAIHSKKQDLLLTKLDRIIKLLEAQNRKLYGYDPI